MIGLNPTITWLIHVKSHYLTPLMSTGGCHPHGFLDIHLAAAKSRRVAEASSTGNMAWHTAQVGNGGLSTKK